MSVLMELIHATNAQMHWSNKFLGDTKMMQIFFFLLILLPRGNLPHLPFNLIPTTTKTDNLSIYTQWIINNKDDG